MDLSYRKLEGNLDLSDFPRLEGLYCSNNQLTNLDLSNNEELKELNCAVNNFSRLNISIFSELINLEVLSIRNNGNERIKNNIYNRFYGSLESLKDCTKLKELYIQNTDINDGVEYLPISIKRIYYSMEERPDCLLTEIEADLQLLELLKFDMVAFKKKKSENLWEDKFKRLEQALEEKNNQLKLHNQTIDELKTLTSKNENLNSKIKSLELELQNKEREKLSQIESLKEKVLDLNNEVKELEVEKENSDLYKRKLTIEKLDREKLSKEKNLLELENNQLKKLQLEQLEKEKKLADELKTSISEKSSLNNQLNILKSESSKQNSNFNNEITKLRTDNSNLNNELSNLRSDQANKEKISLSQLENLRITLNSKEEKINQTLKEYNDLKSKLEVNEVNLNNLRNDIKRNEIDISLKNSSINKLEENNKNLEEDKVKKQTLHNQINNDLNNQIQLLKSEQLKKEEELLAQLAESNQAKLKLEQAIKIKELKEKNLISEIENLNSEISKFKFQLEKNRDEKDNLEKKIISLQYDLVIYEDFKTDLNTIENFLTDLRNEDNKLNTEILTSYNANKDASKKLYDVQNELLISYKEKDKVDLERKEILENVEDLQLTLQTKEKKLKKILEENKDLKDKLGINEIDLDDLRHDIERKERNINAKDAIINKFEESRKVLQADIKALDEELIELKKNADENKVKIKKLERKRRDLEEDLAEAEENLNIVTKEKEKLTEELNELKIKENPPVTLLPEVEKIKSLTEELNKLKKDSFINNLPKFNNEVVNEKNNEIISNLVDLKENISDKKTEKNSLEGQISEKETLKENLKKAGDTNSDEYRKLLAELEELRQRLASIDKELTTLRMENDNLKAQTNATYQTLEDEIETIKESLSIKRVECEENVTIGNLISNVFEGKSSSEKLDRLLQVQIEITKSNSQLASDLKTEIINSANNQKLLEEICQLKEHLTQLELKKASLEQIIHSLKIVTVAPILPPHLVDSYHNYLDKFKDNNSLEITTYNDKNFQRDKEFTLSSSLNSLPFRLYNIKENKVELTNNLKCHYAILSYVWGNLFDKDNLINDWEYTYQTKTGDITKKIGVNDTYGVGTTPESIKSLQKAINACQLLNINYLWVDQMCIDQFNDSDKNREVPKMREYYSNASATLISIQTSLGSADLTPEAMLKKIIQSSWFDRSWTFQEGWLSKQTFYMFDNYLVDGSLLANQWVLGQPAYSDGAKAKSIINDYSEKIATPLGWTYYQNGYNEEDSVSFSLNQALRTIKNRGRFIPADGFYSILGMLPYGNKVEVDYDSKLAVILFKTMKTAFNYGHAEVLSWHGIGSSWLPRVYIENDAAWKKGGTNIEGGINLLYKQIEKINSASFLFNVFKFEIASKPSNINHRERINRGSTIDSGATTAVINLVNNLSINLLSLREVIEAVKTNDYLLLLDAKEWRWNKPFTLIVRKVKDAYQRVGLAEISEKDFTNLTEVGITEKLSLKFNEEALEVVLTTSIENVISDLSI